MVVLAMLPEMPSLVLAALDATFLSVLVFPLLFLLVYRPVRRHILQREHSNAEKEAAVLSLRKAFDEIDSLRGLLTICAHCKKIQDEEGEWQDVETYVRRHSEACATGYLVYVLDRAPCLHMLALASLWSVAEGTGQSVN